MQHPVVYGKIYPRQQLCFHSQQLCPQLKITQILCRPYDISNAFFSWTYILGYSMCKYRIQVLKLYLFQRLYIFTLVDKHCEHMELDQIWIINIRFDYGKHQKYVVIYCKMAFKWLFCCPETLSEIIRRFLSYLDLNDRVKSITMFKTNGGPLTPGDQKLGWTG